MPAGAGRLPPMHRLTVAARRVVESWECGDLAGAVRELANQLQLQQELRARYPKAIALARDSLASAPHARAGIGVDEDAYLSEAQEGVLVGAWLFIPSDEAQEISYG